MDVASDGRARYTVSEIGSKAYASADGILLDFIPLRYA